MHNNKRSIDQSQLDLFGAFEKSEKRQLRLVNDLLQVILNLKYIRANTRVSDFGNKEGMEQLLDTILYWVAYLSWRKGKDLPDFKDMSLDQFKDKTRDRSDISTPTDRLSNDYLAECYFNSNKRLKTLLMAYKDLLQNERSVVDRLLNYYDQLTTLTHAI